MINKTECGNNVLLITSHLPEGQEESNVSWHGLRCLKYTMKCWLTKKKKVLPLCVIRIVAFRNKAFKPLIFISFFGSVRTIYQLIFLLKLRLQLKIKACVNQHVFVFANAGLCLPVHILHFVKATITSTT
jgi:hypothetical protein